MSDRTNVCSTDSVGICFAHGHNAGLVCANDYSSSPGDLSAAGVDDSFKSVAAQKRIKKIAVHNFARSQSEAGFQIREVFPFKMR